MPPPPPPPPPNGFFFGVEEIAGKGLGCVARRDIAAHTEVLRARCTLRAAGGTIWSRAGFGSLLRQYDALGEEARRGVRALHPYMPRAMQADAALFLHGAAEGGEGRRALAMHLAAVWCANAFEMARSTTSGADDDGEGDTGLFPEASRFNHACLSNAEWNTVQAPGWLVVRTVRAVRRGEELTVAYVSPLKVPVPSSSATGSGSCASAAEARRRYLRDTWGFDCACALCDRAGDRGDKADQLEGLIAEIVASARADRWIAHEERRAGAGADADAGAGVLGHAGAALPGKGKGARGRRNFDGKSGSASRQLNHPKLDPKLDLDLDALDAALAASQARAATMNRLHMVQEMRQEQKRAAEISARRWAQRPDAESRRRRLECLRALVATSRAAFGDDGYLGVARAEGGWIEDWKRLEAEELGRADDEEERLPLPEDLKACRQQ